MKKPASIDEVVNALSADQKRLLDLVWSHYSKTGEACPARQLQRELGVRLSEVLPGLNGGQVFETNDHHVKGYKLTLLGALLTGHRNFLFGLLVHLATKAKELYDAGSQDKEVSSEAIDLPEVRSLPLHRLLMLGPPRGMPYSFPSPTNSGAWKVSITDDVMELHGMSEAEIGRYLQKVLLAVYNESEPYDYRERLATAASGNRLPWEGVLHASDRGVVKAHRRAENAFVNSERIKELEQLPRDPFDCRRLVLMCRELCDCAERENAHATIMLIRAILDHVPPIFKRKSFAEVANNHGGKSFKEAMQNLEGFSRKIADMYLHSQIRKTESPPTMTQVHFSAPLDVLLAEVVTILRKP